jgi:hypothetical protein
MRSVTLRVLTSPSCMRCEEFFTFWDSIAGDWVNVETQEVSLLSEEGQALAFRHRILAAPGIIIEDELVSVGGFDKDALLVRLQELSFS